MSSSTASKFSVHSGFEYLGVAEGKVILRPIEGNNTDNLTYQDAIVTCVSAGYQLLTVETAAQENILKSQVCRESNWRWSWIDGVDFQTPDVFFSINTGKNLTYFNWVSGRPVLGNDDRNCIRYSCNAIDGPTMWDVPCTDKYSVFCQVVA